MEIIKPKFEQVPTSEKSIEVSQSLEELSPDLRAMDEHLSKGYDINVQNEDGVSMLMRAVEKQSPEMTAYLISKGINVDLRDINGLTAFDYIDKVPDDKVRQEMLEIFSRLNDTKQPSLNVEPEPDLEAEPIEETPPISEPAPNEEPEEQPSSQTLPWVFGILILLTVVSLTLRSRKNT